MKKLFLTLICLFAVCVSYAQTDNAVAERHLKFKGIPIDGTPSEFGTKLKEAGFSYVKIVNGTRWYNGPFAGYNNCDVAVKANNNLVYEVVVIFPKDYSWWQLYNTYSSLKDMLSTSLQTLFSSSAEDLRVSHSREVIQRHSLLISSQLSSRHTSSLAFSQLLHQLLQLSQNQHSRIFLATTSHSN